LKNFIIGICVALGILALAVCYFAFGRQYANSCIQNYEWFYNQYEAIKSTSVKAKLSEGSERTAIIMVLNDMIAEYNSRSKMTVTRVMWKSDSLPYQIDIKDFIEE